MVTLRNMCAELSKKIIEKRKFETIDLVKRLKVITGHNIRIKNYPGEFPRVAFNPSIHVFGNNVRIYARVIMGYYTYTSAIAEFEFPLEELYDQSRKTYEAEFTVLPDTKYDLWGVEDPRVYEIDGKLLMTYCGRTVNYFRTDIRNERTLPVTARYENGKWKKIAVFRMPEEIRSFVVSDKNAFLVKTNKLMLFHRLHMLNEKFYLAVCNVPEEVINADNLQEIEIGENITIMEEAPFESKIGWATPPIKVNDENLVLIHGVDKELSAYRVFAVLINKEGYFTAVTPSYILEPKEIYEKYGDRPFVVFPCGIQKLEEKLIISYGGADTTIVIGEIELEDLMNILEENRID
ncbi:MAG TPA: glycosidase [Aquifex aeolicus]|nr:glycosidase [Aquifex aeolicus]